MNPTTDSALYYLVVEGRGESAIHVFLGHDPRGDDTNGPLGEPVSLELLPASQRFGGSRGVGVGRPALGRRPDGVPMFRQFVTVIELEQAGWLPVRHYRVCDSWEDYHDPWGALPSDGSTVG